MVQYIITGNYTTAAMQGMIANPSDREKAAGALVRAAGGKLEGYFVTTGETDFIMRVSADDASQLLAALVVAAASGGITNLKTVQCFSSKEFMAAQKAAGTIAARYVPPN